MTNGSSGHSPSVSVYNSTSTDDNAGGIVVSALFADARSAYGAIQELRDIGVPAGSISLISRDEGRAMEGDLQGGAGVEREEVMEHGLTYRASTELPNDEDLPTTEAAMTGRDISDTPIVNDFAVPPNGSFGGSERLGLSRDSDMVRRNEADANADEDIYTDFPGQPGGVSPDSPAAESAQNDIRVASDNQTSIARNMAVGAGMGSFVGLVAGLAGLAIPGIGPFIAAGPLAGLLSGLTTGGVAGGMIGALSGIGLPEEHAREYASAIEQGQTLVSVHTDILSRDHVERVLVANGGERVR